MSLRGPRRGGPLTKHPRTSDHTEEITGRPKSHSPQAEKCDVLPLRRNGRAPLLTNRKGAGIYRKLDPALIFTMLSRVVHNEAPQASTRSPNLRKKNAAERPGKRKTELGFIWGGLSVGGTSRRGESPAESSGFDTRPGRLGISQLGSDTLRQRCADVRDEADAGGPERIRGTAVSHTSEP